MYVVASLFGIVLLFQLLTFLSKHLNRLTYDEVADKIERHIQLALCA